jgi:coenzyme F420-reducing hydrogenase beta subunit
MVNNWEYFTNRSATAAGGTRTTQYKKGQAHVEFGDNVKVDDLIIYGDATTGQSLGCTVCNYAPQSLRYLRDHIRKVHLAKTHKCTYCDLNTKRRADLVRHIQRIHEDPKRNNPGGAGNVGAGANAFR